MFFLALAALAARAAALPAPPPAARVNVDVRALQVTAGVSIAFTSPPAGSLGPVTGAVVGLPNPQDYKFCVYLTSTASGEMLTNGPKPFEDAGSFSPIDAAGRFNYVNWWANPVYDVVVPAITGFVWPNALGNCVPFLGVQIPGGLLASAQAASSVAWAAYARENTIEFASIAPAVNNVITVRLAGLPTDAGAVPLAALIYAVQADGGLTGPFPGCSAAAATAVVRSAPGAATAVATIPCAGACATAGWLVVSIVAAAINVAPNAAPPPPGSTDPTIPGGNGICVAGAQPNAGAPLPPGVWGPSLAHAAFQAAQGLAPAASASASASASATMPPAAASASAAAVAAASASASAAAAAASAAPQVVTVTVTVSALPTLPAGGLGVSSGAGVVGVAAAAAAAAAVAAVAALV